MEEKYKEYFGLKEAAAQVEYAQFEPNTQEWFNGRRFLQEEALENALRGNMSVKDALNLGAKKYDEMLNK